MGTHTLGTHTGRTFLGSRSWSETFTHTDLTAAVGLQRTHWYSSKVGFTFGGSFGMLASFDGQGLDAELSLSTGLSF